MWEPRQGVGCILRTINTPPPLVCPGLLVVHLGGPFGQISGMEVGEGMEVTEPHVILHTVFCFTLLCVCVLQGDVGDRCRLVLGCLTGLGAGLRLWLGHGWCLSYADAWNPDACKCFICGVSWQSNSCEPCTPKLSSLAVHCAVIFSLWCFVPGAH